VNEIGVSESEGEGVGMGPKSDDKLVPTAMGNGSEVQERGVEVLATLQSSENELQRDPPRRRNPRRGKQPETI
jgi:hypothetical protein